jgi:hypothetical protein
MCHDLISFDLFRSLSLTLRTVSVFPRVLSVQTALSATARDPGKSLRPIKADFDQALIAVIFNTVKNWR